MRNPRRWGSLVAAALVACLASACVTYADHVDRRVTRGDVRAHVETVALSRKGSPQVTLRLEWVPADVRLLRANLQTDPQNPCGGARAERLGRESGRAVDAPLVPGERLSIAFSERQSPAVLSDELLLGLLLRTPEGKQRCVPLPLADPEHPLRLEPRERFTVGLDFWIEGFPSPLGPVDRLVASPLTVGAWFGDYHLEAGAGIGGAGCPEPDCRAPSKDERINFRTVYPFFAGVGRPVWEGRDYSLGVDVRYRAVKLEADTTSGRETFWMHGPVVMPWFGGTFMRTGAVGTLGGARHGVIGLTVPVGYGFAQGRRSLTIGGGLTLFFTVL